MMKWDPAQLTSDSHVQDEFRPGQNVKEVYRDYNLPGQYLLLTCDIGDRHKVGNMLIIGTRRWRLKGLATGNNAEERS